MSVIEHLEALRRALIVSIVAWGVATIAAIFAAHYVITFLVQRAGIGHAIYLQPGGGALLQLKGAMYIGVVLAGPVIIQQIWWFVSPGRHPRERRFVLPLVVATIVATTSGSTNLRSLGCRPGLTNHQICWMITGPASTTPMYMAPLSWSSAPPPGCK